MELGKTESKVGWKPAEEMTQEMNQAISKAIKYAKSHLIAKAYNGAYFSAKEGRCLQWVIGEPEKKPGLIFIHWTDFKFRGDILDYIEHLEQLVNHLSEKRDSSQADKLLVEARRELMIDGDNYLNRNCEWFRDVEAYLDKNNVPTQGEDDADS